MAEKNVLEVTPSTPSNGVNIFGPGRKTAVTPQAPPNPSEAEQALKHFALGGTQAKQ